MIKNNITARQTQHENRGMANSPLNISTLQKLERKEGRDPIASPLNIPTFRKLERKEGQDPIAHSVSTIFFS